MNPASRIHGAFLNDRSPFVSAYSGRPYLGQIKWPRFLSLYAALHGIWLLLYALFGKGFGYAGFAPFYVGEMLLLLALPALVASRRLAALLRTPLGVVMALFVAWQLACSLPYLDTYGLDAMRDSVVWGYAVFAWVTAALTLRLRGFLKTALFQFRRAARVFLILGPIAWIATLYLGDVLPHWPGTGISIPYIKGNEYCVHLAGILALTLQAGATVPQGWVLLILADAVLAMNVRGGLLAFIVASCSAVLLGPRPGRLLWVAMPLVLLVSGMKTFDLKFALPGAEREISLAQLADSLQSVIDNSARTDLEATKQWRLTWWRTIRDYTFDGPFFWTGKGYGINLADSDGFQVGTKMEPLRSPHNSHITFLARSGVPGFALWVTLQLLWAGQMLRSYLQARRLQSHAWIVIFSWLLVYWVAFIVAAGFDVFLEGPMAGIPFWTIFGLGWGALTLFRRQTGRLAVPGSTTSLDHATGTVHASL